MEMTVGIALEFLDADNRKGIAVISDRMVSVGDWGVEMPAHKPYVLYEREEVLVMGVGAGTLSTISEYMGNLKSALDKESPSDMKKVAKVCNDEYIALLRETIQRELLDPLHISFQELTGQDSTRGKLYEDVEYRIRNIAIPKFFEDLGVLVAGIDKNSSLVFTLEDSLKLKEAGRIGFDAIGSGFDSADWTLMHRQFDGSKDMHYALLLGMYAKIQAEESSGVGRDTDAYVISSNGIREVPQSTLDFIRKEFERDRHRERLSTKKAIERLRLRENEWKKI